MSLSTTLWTSLALVKGYPSLLPVVQTMKVDNKPSGSVAFPNEVGRCAPFTVFFVSFDLSLS